MGTRSNVRFKEDGTVIGCLYRQYDGYPEGIGQDLLDILPGGDPSIVNGWGAPVAQGVTFVTNLLHWWTPLT